MITEINEKEIKFVVPDYNAEQVIKITHLKTLYPSIEEVKIEQLNRVDKNTGKILLDLLIYYRVQKKLMKYRLTKMNIMDL